MGAVEAVRRSWVIWNKYRERGVLRTEPPAPEPPAPGRKARLRKSYQ